MKNIIAVIWDFDKTLVDGYMQDPIFKEYHVDASAFWREVNSLPDCHMHSISAHYISVHQKFINKQQPC